LNPETVRSGHRFQLVVVFKDDSDCVVTSVSIEHGAEVNDGTLFIYKGELIEAVATLVGDCEGVTTVIVNYGRNSESELVANLH